MAKKILFIDDSPTVLAMSKEAFEKEGFAIVQAKTGQEGLNKVGSEKPDLVIIDTLLPDIDGFQVCRKIKQAQAKFTPKIIIVTGAVDAIDAVKAREAGADDYCAKTSDLTRLIELAKKLI